MKMKGLIIKEFFGLRQYSKVLGFLLLAYIVLAWGAPALAVVLFFYPTESPGV